MRKLRRILLLIGIAVALLWWFLPSSSYEIEPGSILVLDLEGSYVESPQPPLLSRLLGDPRRPFAALLSEFAKAQRDERLAAVVLRVRNLEVGWAKAQEIHNAIARLRESGRRTVAILEFASFGANLEYFVASAAEDVYAEPGTRAPLVGLAADFLFLGGFWERIGIDIEVERIGKYKTIADTIAGRSMSEANREMADSLLDSLDAQLVGGVAAARGLTPEQVKAAIDAAPFSPREMIAHDLVDGSLFLDELISELGDGPVVKGDEYARVEPSDVGFSPVAHLALVYGSGAVVTGRGSNSRGGSPVLASDTVSEALAEAADDPEIDGILFRIDSPGGSALASDVVWRAALRAREGGKPLIASFSDVAASGGYYVAAGADAILASPGTITGSIGVVVVRPVLGRLFDKLDIGFTSLSRGRHADLQLLLQPLDADTRALVREEVASTYAQFVDRVADGRSLAREQVDQVGRGRVWTGAQAVELGLVDALGGLHEAVLSAKLALNLDPDADVALIPYPKPSSLVEQVAGAFQGAILRAQAVSPGSEWLRRLEPWLSAAKEGGPAVLLPFFVEVH